MSEAASQFKSLTMTILMTPDTANFSGNVHGGALLKMLDQVAYACASRYSGTYVVTVSVDQIVFHEPLHVGELATFQSSINYTGKTSMEVGVRVMAENIQLRTSRHVMTCYFTMVAVDADRKPTPVPQLLIETAADQRRWAAARLRKELRKQIEQASIEIRQHPEDFGGDRLNDVWPTHH